MEAQGESKTAIPVSSGDACDEATIVQATAVAHTGEETSLDSSKEDIPESWRTFHTDHSVHNPTSITNPFDTWREWWTSAMQTEDSDAHAAYLCTCGADLMPQIRDVAISLWDSDGIVFGGYTESQMAQELERNNKASLVLRWASLDRQVRINGIVTPTTRSQSVFLFRRCSREEQIGFWALGQGKRHIVYSGNPEPGYRRAGYMRRVFLQFREDDTSIPMPPAWGGFVLRPTSFEFLGNERTIWSKGAAAGPEGEKTNWTKKLLVM
eukprot:TRINITY_DN6718_c0_g1_i1.p1 TRINITY_DN6718_c0_g1~~TRINITY_DN6718_c0_g1_i1.p1  ORF type:complete len:267 (+),score=36.90 TRINITY_DN6718_c0_g1_i1:17-817(+)